MLTSNGFYIKPTNAKQTTRNEHFLASFCHYATWIADTMECVKLTIVLLITVIAAWDTGFRSI